jgi:DNA-binding NarL/FixJ family response regulator
MPIRTFVVDRQEVARWGLTLACSDAADIEVVGTAESISNSFDAIIAAAPDVIIVDFQPNIEAELDHTRRILAALPHLKLLVFSAIDSRHYVQEVLDSGASGYITKDASLAEVLIAVRAIREGRIFISHAHPSPAAPKHCFAVKRPGTTSRVENSESETLSAREREVVLMLAEGLTNKEVAKRLFLSVKTVETYRSRVMKKYQLRGRSELFSFAKQLSESHSGSETVVPT